MVCCLVLQTGHTEAVRLQYDSSVVNYSELLTVLWDRMDPTTKNRQVCQKKISIELWVYWFDSGLHRETIMARSIGRVSTITLMNKSSLQSAHGTKSS
jgi:peptide methionine sulfoxide reductase MsrA